jgi:hypothetical protein
MVRSVKRSRRLSPTMISVKKRTISWNEIAHDIRIFCIVSICCSSPAPNIEIEEESCFSQFYRYIPYAKKNA